MSKNIPLWKIIDSEENQKVILTEMHNNSDYCEYEKIYQWVANCY